MIYGSSQYQNLTPAQTTSEPRTCRNIFSHKEYDPDIVLADLPRLGGAFTGLCCICIWAAMYLYQVAKSWSSALLKGKCWHLVLSHKDRQIEYRQ